MPNWVYNKITVSGLPEEVVKFEEHIFTKPNFFTDEQWNDRPKFSFHSFISLDPKYQDEYYGINGWKDGEHLGQSEHNWYQWNNNNWNTKWDASDVELDTSHSRAVEIAFSTAWSPPFPVFEAMSKQFPALTVNVWWEEEQGFGQTLEIIDGVMVVESEWEIPSSHEEYIRQDKECVCSWDDDEESWYDDCPRNTIRVYEIHSITKYYIEAVSPVKALDAAKAEDGGLDLPDGTKVVDVAYSEEYVLKNLTEREAEKEETSEV